MARFFTRSTTSTRTPDAAEQPSARLHDHREGVACDSYAPGHLMHYIHQGQALRSPSLHASNVIVEGTRVIVVLESGEQLDYHHHDPDRLGSVLGLFPGTRVVYPKFHALRIGPYWFNCAPSDFQPCKVDAAPAS